ncbi:glycosyltransferase [Kocuria sp.]|uniref:glycosyltransferase n=1 Tax=Kocuria sp. TaxID=1871328 RepID=UPI0026E07AE8|nr:glycosyltransferase [Kocuria sp.]MDO5619159.1 glycosyltransferase [Kocuria sp.]
MKVLFTSFGASTHLSLLMPLAHAFTHAGHRVCIASHADAVPFLQRAGLPYVIVSPKWDKSALEQTAGEYSQGPRVPPEIETSAPGRSFIDFDDSETSGQIAAKLAVLAFFVSGYMTDDAFTARICDFARSWDADLVVWDSLTYAGSVAAEIAGATSVRSLFGIDQASSLRRRYQELGGSGDPLSSWLAGQVKHHGGRVLDLATESDRLAYGDLTVNPMPDGVHTPPDHARIDIANPGFFSSPMPSGSWLESRHKGGRPRVCVTIGLSSREHNLKIPPIGVLMDALRDLDLDVLVTLNEAEARKAGFFREGFSYTETVSFDGLFPSIDLVIHHFGTGTLLAAYRSGVPQIHFEAPVDYWGERLLSRRLHQTGHVWTIDHGALSREEMRDLIVAALADRSARERAFASRDSYMARRSPSVAVRDIVAFVESGELITGSAGWGAADDPTQVRLGEETL